MITPAKEAMIIAELEGDPEDSRMVDSGVVDIEQSPTWKSKHEQRKLKFIIVLSIIAGKNENNINHVNETEIVYCTLLMPLGRINSVTGIL